MRQKSGESRGFGFVSYKDRASVDKVLAEQNLELDGRRVSVFRERGFHIYFELD